MRITRGSIDREGFIRLEIERREVLRLIDGIALTEVEADGTRITIIAEAIGDALRALGVELPEPASDHPTEERQDHAGD